MATKAKCTKEPPLTKMHRGKRYYLWGQKIKSHDSEFHLPHYMSKGDLSTNLNALWNGLVAPKSGEVMEPQLTLEFKVPGTHSVYVIYRRNMGKKGGSHVVREQYAKMSRDWRPPRRRR